MLDSNKKRIWELDFLRGICIVLMVLDHTFYNMAFVFDTVWLESTKALAIGLSQFSKAYWSMPLRTVTRGIVLWVLFGICGISNSFSKSNLRRGLQLLALALLITLFTTALPIAFSGLHGIEIRFGVLHMLATCILIWCVVDYIFKDTYKTATACFVIATIVFIIGSNINAITANLDPKTNFWAFLHPKFAKNYYGFSPGDFFPLIPNLGMFMTGAAIGPVIYKKRKSLLPILDKLNWYRPINIVGRNTLIVLILHQPIITITLALVSAIFVDKWNFVIF